MLKPRTRISQSEIKPHQSLCPCAASTGNIHPSQNDRLLGSFKPLTLFFFSLLEEQGVSHTEEMCVCRLAKHGSDTVCGTETVRKIILSEIESLAGEK